MWVRRVVDRRCLGWRRDVSVPSVPPAPYAGGSTGCLVLDPSGTGGCVTAALAWLTNQVTARLGTSRSREGHIWSRTYDTQGWRPYPAEATTLLPARARYSDLGSRRTRPRRCWDSSALRRVSRNPLSVLSPSRKYSTASSSVSCSLRRPVKSAAACNSNLVRSLIRKPVGERVGVRAMGPRRPAELGLGAVGMAPSSPRKL